MMIVDEGFEVFIVRMVKFMVIGMMARATFNKWKSGFETKEKLNKGSLTMHFMLCVGLLVKGEWRQELRAAPI